MMRRITFLFLIIILFALYNTSYTQPTIEIPWGMTPTIDGVVSPGEWLDSDTVYILIKNESDSIPVLFQYDSLALYFAFLGNLESGGFRFPEILIDVSHDQNSVWLSDDWWFHVSATDCEYQGEYGNYANCQLVRPNWTAEPNFIPGGKLTDTVEIAIPLTTMSLDWLKTDTFGIAFNVTNTANLWEYWPATADKNLPQTWANATFPKMNNTGITDELTQKVTVFPNPTSGSFNLSINLRQTSDVSWTLKDITGKTLFVERLGLVNRKAWRVSKLDNLPSGIYIATINIGNMAIHKKVILTK